MSEINLQHQIALPICPDQPAYTSASTNKPYSGRLKQQSLSRLLQMIEQLLMSSGKGKSAVIDMIVALLTSCRLTILRRFTSSSVAPNTSRMLAFSEAGLNGGINSSYSAASNLLVMNVLQIIAVLQDLQCSLLSSLLDCKRHARCQAMMHLTSKSG